MNNKWHYFLFLSDSKPTYKLQVTENLIKSLKFFNNIWQKQEGHVFLIQDFSP